MALAVFGLMLAELFLVGGCGKGGSDNPQDLPSPPPVEDDRPLLPRYSVQPEGWPAPPP